LPFLVLCLFSSYAHPRDLHSFPTRRSSDLSLLIDSSSPEFRGKAYGYFYAFFSIGVVAGSSLIGYLDLTFKGGFMLTGIILLAVGVFTILGMKKNLALTEEY